MNPLEKCTWNTYTKMFTIDREECRKKNIKIILVLCTKCGKRESKHSNQSVRLKTKCGFET